MVFGSLICQTLGESGHSVDKLLIRRALIVGTFGQLGGISVKVGLHGIDMGKRFAHLLLHGKRVIDLHVLGKVSDSDIFRHRHYA